jgi:hypothetical protein
MSATFARATLLLCSMIAACGNEPGVVCAIDGDCASGFCKADGTCGPAEVDGGAGDGDGGTDAMTAVCAPNHDGVITASELPMAAGKAATFRIATDATWNTAGTDAGNGQRAWDLSGTLANDQDTDVMLAAPTGTWWADTFPGASYSSLLAAGSDLSGVFKRTGNKVELLGVVSPADGSSRTELEYDGAAQILAVPLMAGTSWTSTSIVSGVFSGAGLAYTEKYESRVDQTGTMTTPYGAFPVLRVVTDLTRTSGGFTILTKRTFSWVAECFGPVATAASTDNETDDEFSDLAEVRRLAP